MQPTEKTRVKRGPKRATYDTEAIYAILDEAFICHIGGTIEGTPVVQPNLHWRIGNKLYIHGSVKNGLIRSILQSGQTCITVSLMDGLVMAKSAFHHSVNYRSVMVFGKPVIVEDPSKKIAVLDALLEKCMKGRSKEARAANDIELKATTVIEIAIDEASAKIRTGGPIDDPEDEALPIWAGVLPCETRWGDAITYP